MKMKSEKIWGNALALYRKVELVCSPKSAIHNRKVLDGEVHLTFTVSFKVTVLTLLRFFNLSLTDS